MFRKVLIALPVLLLASGCTQPITMVDTRTGETRTCGPFYLSGVSDMTALRERKCVQDYKEQGFVRQ